jgi:Zn-dependent peptidase ImmA (M78 family)
MASRDVLLRASRRAAEVYQSCGAAERISHEGYTRVDPFDVAAVANITVMLQPMQNLLGAFIREANSGILVNADRPAGLIHMTCAHELGHYFLGHKSTADETIEYGAGAAAIEQEADWFAYQLLMPRTLIAKTMRRKGWTTQSLRDPKIVYQLSLRLGASYRATVWSLFRQQLLPLSTKETEELSRVTPQRIKREIAGLDLTIGAADVWQLDRNDQDTVIEPRPSDVFVIDLPSHASAGYLWTLTDTEEAGFQLTPKTVTSNSARAQYLEEPTVGSNSTQRYFLTNGKAESGLLGAVRHCLRFSEEQPWVGISSRKDEFCAGAKYESINYGLSPLSREQLIDEIARS